MAKSGQHPELRDFLLGTGSRVLIDDLKTSLQISDTEHNQLELQARLDVYTGVLRHVSTNGSLSAESAARLAQLRNDLHISEDQQNTIETKLPGRFVELVFDLRSFWYLDISREITRQIVRERHIVPGMRGHLFFLESRAPNAFRLLLHQPLDPLRATISGASSVPCGACDGTCFAFMFNVGRGAV